MRVRIDGWANLPKSQLSTAQQAQLRDKLTIFPRKTSEYQEDILPLHLYDEDAEWFRVPREWFLRNHSADHIYDMVLSDGAGQIPEERSRLAETYTDDKGQVHPFWLREEQQEALSASLRHYRESFDVPPNCLGMSLQAAPAWGKTILAAALISAVRRKSLVLVNKTFLLNQWMERLKMVMPGIRVGIIQEKKCEVEADVCIGMLDSLSLWAEEMKKVGPDVACDPGWQAKVRYDPNIRHAFGVVFSDEEHRLGAHTWAGIIPMFDARFRVGITATPRRKDRCENAFFWHIGPIRFTAVERRMTPKIRRVWTHFHMTQTASSENLPTSIIEKFMAASPQRNRCIAEQLILAMKADRTVIVMSTKLKHLDRIRDEFQKLWKVVEEEATKRGEKAREVRIDYYVGGRKQKDLDVAGEADVILATFQMASEGLDLPWVDTLFLAMPKSDVEQPVGRILRPYEGKQDPIVTDFIDDEVDDFKSMATKRNRFYESLIQAKQPGFQIRRNGVVVSE